METQLAAQKAMWYKARPMVRRGVSLTILALIAVQLLGTMAVASVCLEPCPDDTEGTSCPPICSLCTSCTHAQTAIVQQAAIGEPLLTARDLAIPQAYSPSSQLADDIFHVPLLG